MIGQPEYLHNLLFIPRFKADIGSKSFSVAAPSVGTHSLMM